MTREYMNRSLDRRDFLKTAFATAAAGALTRSAAAPALPGASVIDTNVHLSRWPTRRLRGDDAEALAAMLRKQGGKQAWAGTLDPLLQKDIAGANARLAEACRRHGRDLFVPFGTVNPLAADWEEDLRRCAEEHRMPGIRLYPNYHGFRLDDPAFARLLGMAAERHSSVQMAIVMQDERMMHPLMRVEPVDTAPLAAVVRKTPHSRLVLLNALRTVRGQPLLDLIRSGDVYVEMAMLEGLGALGTLLEHIPVERILFGSNAPLFYLESAFLKLKESSPDQGQLARIVRQNAPHLLKK